MRTIERNGESKLKQKLSTRPAEIMALEWMLSVNVKEYKQVGLDLSNQIFQRSNDIENSIWKLFLSKVI